MLRCGALEQITIPSSVTDIDERAFEGCYALKRINVASDNQVYSSADGVLFNKEKTKIICCPVAKKGEYIIPNGVTEIGDLSFEFSVLEKIVIPDSIITIGNGAFFDSKLTEIVIPNSVTNIERGAFQWCSRLEKVVILNRNVNIGKYVFEESKKVTIYGYIGSTVENYANQNNINFISIDSNDNEYYSNYYGDTGNYIVVIRNAKGMGISGCTITIDGETKETASSNTNITIPEGYSGNITVSKKGYLTSTLPVSELKKYNFFVMYEENTKEPVIQHFLIKRKNYSSMSYNDLLKGKEYIYDMGLIRHDIYISVNENGTKVSKIYLEQGKNRIELKNGLNKNVGTNTSFNSKEGTIYVCIETTNGKIYKMNSNIVALEKSISLKINEQKAETVIDDSIEGIGGQEIKFKFGGGTTPISFTIGEEGKVKGTIGIKSEEKYNATWYENIKDTITKHEKSGETKYTTKEMEKLEESLKDNNGYIKKEHTSFGYGVEASIVGYIEGYYNRDNGDLRISECGIIFSISGSMSTSQQRVFMVGAVPVPYYWQVKFETELSAEIGLEFNSQNSEMKADIIMPEISVEISVAGSLCLGIKKVVGIGGQLQGGIKVNFNGPDYKIENSKWTVTIDAFLLGQILGKEYTYNISELVLGRTHVFEEEIYPRDNKKTKKLSKDNANSLIQIVSKNSSNIQEKYSLTKASYELNTEKQQYVFKENGYNYSSPNIAKLNDGTTVMVWVDYDYNRQKINQTALYYSVLKPECSEWSEPRQVENDGTADDMPVLKVIDNKMYLAWNDCSEALEPNSTLIEQLSKMDISFAEFNGNEFISITNLSNNNLYMDIAADFTIIEDKPIVTWISNDKNDIFGQTGNNKIMISKYDGEKWDTETLKEEMEAINSVAICNEENEYSVYISKDTDNDIYTADDYEVFKITKEGINQVTNNDVQDNNLISSNNSVYWLSNGNITNGEETIEVSGVINDFKVIENENKEIIIYCTEDEKGNTKYYTCLKQSDGKFSIPVQVLSSNDINGGYSAYYDNDKIVVALNKVSREDFSSKICIDNFIIQPKISINDAYYNNYTLTKSGVLKTYVILKNEGLKEIQNYTINIYGKEQLLYTEEVNEILMQGESKKKEINIKLPNEIDFNSLRIEIKSSSDEKDSYELKLGIEDISIEETIIISEEDKDIINSFIVNRGIQNIEEAVISLRKDTEDGEVIKTIKINDLKSGEEENIQIQLNNKLEEGKILYLTIEQLENEENLANNSDFAVKDKISIVELIDTDKQQLLGDINEDGYIDTEDARMILKYVIGQKDFTEKQSEIADINKDGEIDTEDARKVLLYSVGKYEI